MATFPESPAPIYPLSIEPRWATLISTQGGGREQRRGKAEFPVYDVAVRYHGLSPANMATLYDFYMARRGALEAFYIYDLALLNGTSFAHTGLYVDAGDGSTEVFDIPGRSTSSQTIYVNGVLQTLTTDYVILTGSGDGSSDQVDFVSAPDSGDILSCGFTGYLRMRVRFAEDRLSRELFNYRLFDFGVQMVGVQVGS